MRRKPCLKAGRALLMLLLWVPAIAGAQPPPIDGPLVRQGDFASLLLSELGLGMADNEVDAEIRLGAVGIRPRNGWIADYPVTPDIAGELQGSVADAADAGRIPLGAEEALKRFQGVSEGYGLPVRPYTGSGSSGTVPSGNGYANPESIHHHYASEGAPVYTYYTPPVEYYYQYTWVPYPFWHREYWFPGFFILHDFHRHRVVGNRVVLVSNHFNDSRHHRVFRVDPLMRYQGKTYPGIGAPRSKHFLSTGIPGSDRKVFNPPPERRAPAPPWGTPGKGGPPWGTPGKKSGPPWGSRGTVTPGSPTR